MLASSWQQPHIQDRFGSFFLDFGTHAYLWGVEELVRMFVMSALVVVFSKESAMQLIIGVVTAVAAVVLHVAYQPFPNRSLYWLQTTFLLSISVVLYLGLVFKVRAMRCVCCARCVRCVLSRWSTMRCGTHHCCSCAACAVRDLCSAEQHVTGGHACVEQCPHRCRRHSIRHSRRYGWFEHCQTLPRVQAGSCAEETCRPSTTCRCKSWHRFK